METPWASDDAERWEATLASYAEVIAAQGVARLPELDRWQREELPAAVAARAPAFVTLDELSRVTEWKMARGVWRQRNLVLVRSNAADLVEQTSREALALIPHPTRPVAALARLAGVGPATASAVLTAAAPEHYPFFDELVADQVPDLGPVAFTLSYYARYAEALRERARRLGDDWTPTRVERALWAAAGGKAGRSATSRP
jgi:hypothetical protein